MPSSSRMRFPYPAEFKDPWFDDFESLIAGIDASGYAAREDRNLLLAGGGTITWNVGTSTLSWSSDIVVVSTIVGFLLRVTDGSVTLDDGQMLCVTLVRAPTSGTTIATFVESQIPSDDTSLVLALRIGDRIHWRNGVVQDDGETLTGLGSKQGVVTGLQSSIDLPRKDYVQAPVPVEEVLGQFMFDGSKIPLGASVYLRTMMNATFSAPGTANIHFYDLGPSSGPPGVPTRITGVSPSVFALEVAAAGLVYLQTSALALGPGPAEGVIMATPRMYEATVIQSSVPADTVDVGMASIFTEI